MSSTAILGGGISGLSAAFYLSKNGKQSVKLLEKSKRLGGWIQTENNVPKGFRFENGPRTIRPGGIKGRNTLHMIEDLQLQDSLNPISRNHVAAKNRMIYAHGQLCMLPSSFSSIFKKLPPFSKPLVSVAIHDLLAGPSASKLQDESIYSFTERRFGTEAAKYLISSMICGICAGDAKQISVKFLMKDIFEMEQKHGSVLKGAAFEWLGIGKNKGEETVSDDLSDLVKRAESEKWSIYSFNEGLEILPQKLAEYVKAAGTSIQMNSNCESISLGKNQVTLNIDGSSHSFDSLISSIPSYQLASLVQSQHPKLANDLNEIQYVDVAVVNLQYEGDDILEHQGFGFLVPPSEKLPILGVIFDSCCFPSNGKTVLTVMMGGAWFNELFGTKPNNKDLYEIATQQVANILKIRQKPTTGRVHVLSKCIPQYVVGHQSRVDRIRKYIAQHELPLVLCGAAYDGVGVNDVIYSARNAVKTMLKK